MNIPRIPIKDGSDLPPEQDWCYDCSRSVDECVCEELTDFHRDRTDSGGVCSSAPPEVTFPVPVLANANTEVTQSDLNTGRGEARESTKRNSEPLREATDSRGGETTSYADTQAHRKAMQESHD